MKLGLGQKMEFGGNEARTSQAFEITFAHSAQCGLLSFGTFARCGAVSRGWRGAVDAGLRMSVHLNFRGHEARVTGGVVRRALERIAGPSLRSVGLANCRGISPAEAEEILDRLAATCPKVEQMDVTGCTLEVVIRAFAVRTRHALSAASPVELYARINALQEEEGGDRTQFEDLRSRLMELPGLHCAGRRAAGNGGGECCKKNTAQRSKTRECVGCGACAQFEI